MSFAMTGLRSQPTYKEWKRLQVGAVHQEEDRSQPTYKEWKPTMYELRAQGI